MRDLVTFKRASITQCNQQDFVTLYKLLSLTADSSSAPSRHEADFADVRNLIGSNITFHSLLLFLLDH